jgi:hypothetical protein
VGANIKIKIEIAFGSVNMRPSKGTSSYGGGRDGVMTEMNNEDGRLEKLTQ